MYRKILLGGVTAAAIIGAGGTALAVSGSDSTTAGVASAHARSGSTASATPAGTKAKGKHGRNPLLRRLSHGQFVTRGKGGAFVTHDLVRGAVTAVSATSITVQAADKTTETFAVTKDTKVRTREHGKAADSTISSVPKGARVAVAGTGASTFTAKRVVYLKGAK